MYFSFCSACKNGFQTLSYLLIKAKEWRNQRNKKLHWLKNKYYDH